MMNAFDNQNDFHRQEFNMYQAQAQESRDGKFQPSNSLILPRNESQTNLLRINSGVQDFTLKAKDSDQIQLIKLPSKQNPSMNIRQNQPNPTPHFTDPNRVTSNMLLTISQSNNQNNQEVQDSMIRSPNPRPPSRMEGRNHPLNLQAFRNQPSTDSALNDDGFFQTEP